MAGKRFENLHGASRIERHAALGARPPANEVSITFDGYRLPAREGESLLAALLAAGVRVVRTMPKTGESRGGYCLAGRCSDCLMIVNGVPNVVVCTTPVCADMVVETQHGLGHWPGAAS